MHHGRQDPMITDDSVLVLGGSEIGRLLRGREPEVLAAVKKAYESHARGETVLPHSTFLRFPHRPPDRIIALPAYLGGEFDVAGVKWISSFPGNVERGIDRASAAILLNSTDTGRLQAILEGALVSAQRTAASAALAAQALRGTSATPSAGLVGCGVLNAEILRFLSVVFPDIDEVRLFDVSEERARAFRDHHLHLGVRGERFVIVPRIEDALAAPLVSFATTAAVPHVASLAACPPGATILHISLRDLAPEVVLTCDNIVDDIDHVCRSQTSLHLAEQITGHRRFIRCTLGDVLTGRAAPAARAGTPVVFSPFGLGILDLAVAHLAVARARAEGEGHQIHGFASQYWTTAPARVGV